MVSNPNYKSLLEDAPTNSHFEKIGISKRHGIAIPLFSLRTKNSLGIGEYLDLIPLIDWLKKLKLNIIQLLPINDIGGDPSPYSALSSCALNPLYISLHKLPHIKNYPSLIKEMEEFSKENEKPFVDWERVTTFKYSFLKTYYDLVFDKIKKLDHYQTFLVQNPWLSEYALFKALKHNFPNKGWTDFPKDLQNISTKEMQNQMELHKDHIDYYFFLQYICHEQMSSVKKYADKKNILLKGDIPILLSKDSADVFFHKHLFNLDLEAGAPPDFYNAKGQNWCFPPFNWENVEKSDFHWWKRRLRSQEDYFHMYRIDHVVGFYRIWTIAHGKTPLTGKFAPNNLYLWKNHGEKLLKMLIESSTMLPLAEDLGTVPHYVFSSLKELGILGTRVVRWMKYYDEDGSFLKSDSYEPLTMTTLSTHDAEPTKLWWEKFPIEAKAFANFLNVPYQKKLSLETHKKILSFSHHTSSLLHVNPLQEYTSCFDELTYSDLEDERVNTPGTHEKTNWSFRTKAYLEDLALHKGLNTLIKEVIS